MATTSIILAHINKSIGSFIIPDNCKIERIMKIAYLITAFHQYDHLDRLITGLNDENIFFYIHIDKKAEMPKNICGDNIFFIKRLSVWWGGWSHQQAILNLMHKAAKKEFDYYVLLSGTDYPIRPNSFLYEKLQEGGEYINIIKGFQPHKPESRIKYYHYDNFDRRNGNSLKTKFFHTLEKYQRKLIQKSKYPFKQIFHGSTWWVLSHNCVSYILEYQKSHPKMVDFYKTAWCPEESFIPTIIGNSAFLENCKGNLTYTDWSTNPAPAIMTESHIEQFKEQEKFDTVYGTFSPFFARKFNDDSRNLIEKIEKEMR